MVDGTGFPTIYTGDTHSESDATIDISQLPEEAITYIDQAPVNAKLFQRMADELQQLIDHAYILYLQINADEYDVAPDHLASYDWLNTTLGGDFQGLSFESESLVGFGTNQEVIVNSEHIEYKSYTFTLLSQMIDAGLNLEALPMEIQELYSEYPGLITIPFWGSADVSDHYWQVISEIDVNTFINTLDIAVLSLVEAGIDLNDELLTSAIDASEGYSYVMYLDESREQIAENMIQYVEEWHTTKPVEQFQLNRLAEKIEKMKERPTILDISVTEIIGSFEFFHQMVTSRFTTLSEIYLQLHGADILEAQTNQRLRNFYLDMLNKVASQAGIGSNIEVWDTQMLADMSLEELEAFTRQQLRNLREHVDPTDVLADEYRNRYAEIVGTSEELEALITALETAFLIGGFFPVVGLFADFGDAILSVARGDAIGAILTFVPMEEIFRGVSRLANKVDNVTFLSKLSPNMRGRAEKAVGTVKSIRNSIRERIQKLRDSLGLPGGKPPNNKSPLDEYKDSLKSIGIDNDDLIDWLFENRISIAIITDLKAKGLNDLSVIRSIKKDYGQEGVDILVGFYSNTFDENKIKELIKMADDIDRRLVKEAIKSGNIYHLEGLNGVLDNLHALAKSGRLKNPEEAFERFRLVYNGLNGGRWENVGDLTVIDLGNLATKSGFDIEIEAATKGDLIIVDRFQDSGSGEAFQVKRVSSESPETAGDNIDEAITQVLGTTESGEDPIGYVRSVYIDIVNPTNNWNSFSEGDLVEWVEWYVENGVKNAQNNLDKLAREKGILKELPELDRVYIEMEGKVVIFEVTNNKDVRIVNTVSANEVFTGVANE